jgi:hypothetical protein
MKKYNNIDDIFKDQVSDFQINPSDKVWQNIEGSLFKTKKTNNQKKLLWALASLLLIIGSIFTWILFNNNAEQNILSITTNSNTSNNDNTQTINNINKETISLNAESSLSINKPIITNTPNAENEIVYKNNNNTKTSTSTSNNTLNNNITTDNYNNENHIDYYKSNLGINNLSPKGNYSIENKIAQFEISNTKKITVDEYLEKRKNLHFYTGASASIAMTYYTATTDQPTWSADLTYGLNLKQFYIESGVGFQKMKEEGTFQIEYKTNDSVGYYNKVVSFEVNPNSPNTITYKTQTTTVYDSIEHQVLKSPLYHYDYITIPIKFGYKFFQKDKFSVSAETGIIYSLLTKTYIPTVTYNDNESQLIEISNNTPQRIEHNIRIHIALRLNYNVTKTISLSAQPEFTRYINSIYKKANSNTTKPYTMGVRFGILFDF